MIHTHADTATLGALDADVVVVGAGPLGLVTALRLAEGGRRVLVLESGTRRSDAAAQALAEADCADTRTHHAPEMTVARRLGGTAALWGGRCVPYDPIDFEPRPWLGLTGWPVGGGISTRGSARPAGCSARGRQCFARLPTGS